MSAVEVCKLVDVPVPGALAVVVDGTPVATEVLFDGFPALVLASVELPGDDRALAAETRVLSPWTPDGKTQRERAERVQTWRITLERARERHGLAYQVGAGLTLHRDGGMALIEAATAPKKPCWAMTAVEWPCLPGTARATTWVITAPASHASKVHGSLSSHEIAV